jgi:hypothetical protein
MRAFISLIAIFTMIDSTAFAAFPVMRSDVATSVGDLITAPAVYNSDEKARFIKVNDAREESVARPKVDTTGINVTVDGTTVNGGPAGVDLATGFDVLAVINKAPDVQELTVYRFYTDKATNRRVALPPEHFPISTGKEKWICTPEKNPAGQVIGSVPTWTGTPTGFYNPQWIHADHTSNKYDDAIMYKAVFFTDEGIATHQSPIWGKGPDGKPVRLMRASHGCVRMDPEGSAKMMKYVLATGVTVNPKSSAFQGECPNADELQMNPPALAQCQADAAARGRQWQKMAKDAMQPSETSDGPYSAKQEIPNITPSGKLVRDEAGQPQMKVAPYKSLYVVQCIDKAGRDCSTTGSSRNYLDKKACNPSKKLGQPAPTPENVQAQTSAPTTFNPRTGFPNTPFRPQPQSQQPQRPQAQIQPRPQYQQPPNPIGNFLNRVFHPNGV